MFSRFESCQRFGGMRGSTTGSACLTRISFRWCVIPLTLLPQMRVLDGVEREGPKTLDGSIAGFTWLGRSASAPPAFPGAWFRGPGMRGAGKHPQIRPTNALTEEHPERREQADGDGYGGHRCP